MSPEHAKVLVAEVDPEVAEDIDYWLKRGGHEVVGKAVARTEGAAMLSQIPELAQRYGDDRIVVILGGNLAGPVRHPRDPENDSQVLLKFLQEHGLRHIRTVGYSGLGVPGTTVDVWKGEGPVVLADAVTKLP